MNPIRLTAVVASAAALALCGCGDDGAGDGQGDGEHGKVTEASAPAPAVVLSPAEQTMAEFVEHMRSADFDLAAALTDPTSLGYPEIEKAIEVMANAEERKDEAGSLLPIFKVMLTAAWEQVEYEVLSEEADRVRFDVQFPDQTPSAVDVALIDGEWLVVAPKGIVVMSKIPESMLPPEQPAPPTPAP